MAKRSLNIDTADISILIKSLEDCSLNSEGLSKNDALLRKLRNNLKTIKISSRKGKGRNLQKFVCSEISEMLSIPYDQSDDQSLIHSREMGQAGCDIVLRGGALKRFPFMVECKNSESLNITGTISQAISNTKTGYDWLIVHKRKTLTEPIVIISWNTFKKIVKV